MERCPVTRTPTGCDTFVALGPATRDGHAIFAKNSDRPADESQPLELHGRAEHPAGSRLRTPFVDMPQAAVTYQHVGSRPYWCWGYEHGFNEHQVVVGNEALRSRLRPSGPTLVGMDLVRLGLERGATATEAVEVITSAVSEHGQGEFEHPGGHHTYDNGFIVADPREAYVIETAGHEWAVRSVATHAAISNVYSITGDWDRISPGAEETAAGIGWNGGRLSFAQAFTEGDHLSGSGFLRRTRSCGVLARHEGRIDAGMMMALLSDHADGDSEPGGFVTDIDPGRGICMHSVRGDGAGGNTAASLVADLCDDGSRLPIFWTSMYSPCLGVFLPVFLKGELPASLSLGGAEPSSDSVWWTFRRLAGAVSEAPGPRAAEVRARWAGLQSQLLETAYPVAAKAARMLSCERGREAEIMLGDYMATNLSAAVRMAETLLESYSEDRSQTALSPAAGAPIS